MIRRYIAECRSLVNPSIKFTEVYDSSSKAGSIGNIKDLAEKTDESDLEIKKDYEVLWVELAI